MAADSTNADPATRALWVALAQKFKVPVRCVWFKTPLVVAQHNEAVRSLNTEVSGIETIELGPRRFRLGEGPVETGLN